MGKRGPQPRGEYAGKSAVMSTRIRPDTRAMLVEAARSNNRSLSQEIEGRLRRTFSDDEKISEVFGSRQTFALMKLIGSIIEAIGRPDRVPGHPIRTDWVRSSYLRAQVRMAINVVLDALPPPEGNHIPALAKRAELKGQTRAREIIERVRRADLRLALTKRTAGQHKDAVLKADLGEIIDPKPKTVAAIASASGIGKAKAVTAKRRKGRKPNAR
jgi:hypothetical protein